MGCFKRAAYGFLIEFSKLYSSSISLSFIGLFLLLWGFPCRYDSDERFRFSITMAYNKDTQCRAQTKNDKSIFLIRVLRIKNDSRIFIIENSLCFFKVDSVMFTLIHEILLRIPWKGHCIHTYNICTLKVKSQVARKQRNIQKNETVARMFIKEEQIKRGIRCTIEYLRIIASFFNKLRSAEQSLQPDLPFDTVFACHFGEYTLFFHAKTRANPSRVATQRTLGPGLHRLSVC